MKLFKRILIFITAFIGALIAVILFGKKNNKFEEIAGKQKEQNTDMVKKIDGVIENDKKNNNDSVLADLDKKYNG